MITQDQFSSYIKDIKNFLLKFIIGLVIVVISIDIFLPDISGILNIIKNEKVSLLFYGLVQNPEALYEASLLDSNVGNNKKALMEVNLAIGLLEMHNSQSKLIGKCNTQKEQLERNLGLDNE